jgi:hypothetical protein
MHLIEKTATNSNGMTAPMSLADDFGLSLSIILLHLSIAMPCSLHPALFSNPRWM